MPQRMALGKLLKKHEMYWLRGKELWQTLGRNIADRCFGLPTPAPIFGDKRSALLAWIEGQECIVGCVAWLSDPQILMALNRTELSEVVMQREAHLSRYGAMMPEHPSSIAALYQATHDYAPHTHGGLRVRYRLIGSSNHGKRPVMHHKFLVGCRLVLCRRPEGQALKIVPFSVWYGSWNMTRNAQNDDSALILHDMTVSQLFYKEWRRLWADSEPITGVMEDPVTYASKRP
jgi:hypothetical protein